MTTQGIPRKTNYRNRPNTPAPPAWIPACAGMTVGAGMDSGVGSH